MATPVWQSTDGDWGNTASWTTGVVPVSNDSVLFDDTSQVDVTAGLNQSAVDLDLLWVKSNYRGAIGSSGGALRIAADKCVLEGTGTIFIKGDTGIIDDCVIDMRGGTVSLDGLLGGVHGKSGTCTLEATGSVPGPIESLGAGFTATIESGPISGAASLLVQEGVVTNRDGFTAISPFGAIVVRGGRLIQELNGFGSWMFVVGGHVVYKPSVTPLVRMDQLIFLSGTFDVTEGNEFATFRDRVVGPLANWLGPFDLNVSGTDVDLRNTIP